MIRTQSPKTIESLTHNISLSLVSYKTISTQGDPPASTTYKLQQSDLNMANTPLLGDNNLQDQTHCTSASTNIPTRTSKQQGNDLYGSEPERYPQTETPPTAPSQQRIDEVCAYLYNSIKLSQSPTVQNTQLGPTATVPPVLPHSVHPTSAIAKSISSVCSGIYRS